MIILAIDSGVEKTGFAILEKNRHEFKYLTSGLIRTNKRDNYQDRVHAIYKRLNDVMRTYKPVKVILEELFFCL